MKAPRRRTEPDTKLQALRHVLCSDAQRKPEGRLLDCKGLDCTSCVLYSKNKSTAEDLVRVLFGGYNGDT